jgi:hypothetical protein
VILPNIDHACALALEHLNRSVRQRARWIQLDIHTQASATRVLIFIYAVAV